MEASHEEANHDDSHGDDHPSFERYVDTFQSLDPKATLRHLHVPSLILDARGPHVLSSEDEAETFLTTVMRDLDARGYARSEMPSRTSTSSVTQRHSSA